MSLPAAGVTLYSNAGAADQGGGVLYVAAIAAAIATEAPVELLFRRAVDPRQLARLLPVDLDRVRCGVARPTSRAGELVAVATGRRAPVIEQSTEVPRLRVRHGARLLCEFPMQRQLGRAERWRLGTFQRIVANSAFTAGWIERRWGRAADVLHPPIFPIAPVAKQPWIVAVGRFTAGGRSKQQLEMVETFRRLATAGVHGWELHLAGFVEDVGYFERVREAASGFPVVLHPDLDRAALERLLGAASIVWSATGADRDLESEPERFEHFGIAVGEAMSAGAVPVVHAGGGPVEIVGAAGRTWETADACLAQTFELCHDEALRVDLAAAARRRAAELAFPHFAARARALFLDPS